MTSKCAFERRQYGCELLTLLWRSLIRVLEILELVPGSDERKREHLVDEVSAFAVVVLGGLPRCHRVTAGQPDL